MASLSIEGDELVVGLGRWERVGALRRRHLRIPLSAVVSAAEVHDAYAEVKGFRAPGTGWPGRILLGTWRRRGRPKDFVAVYRHGPGSVIELRDQEFGRLILSEPLPQVLAS